MLTRAFGTLLAAGCLLAATALGGCVGYASYPAIKGDVATNNPNAPPMTDLMIVTLRWIHTRYEPADDYVVNMPEGMLRERVFQILTRVGDSHAKPMTPRTASLPTYYITRLWARGARAEVDILRPIMGEDGQQIALQPITLRLRGGMSPWRVMSFRSWTVGSQSAPLIHFIPEKGDRAQTHAPGHEPDAADW